MLKGPEEPDFTFYLISPENVFFKYRFLTRVETDREASPAYKNSLSRMKKIKKNKREG